MTPEELKSKWRSGVNFTDAWFEYAGEYSRGKIANASSSDAHNAQRMMMVADVWAMLDSEELCAAGFRTAPVVREGLEIIPAELFHHRPAHWRRCRPGVYIPERPVYDGDELRRPKH